MRGVGGNRTQFLAGARTERDRRTREAVDERYRDAVFALIAEDSPVEDPAEEVASLLRGYERDKRTVAWGQCVRARRHRRPRLRSTGRVRSALRCRERRAQERRPGASSRSSPSRDDDGGGSDEPEPARGGRRRGRDRGAAR